MPEDDHHLLGTVGFENEQHLLCHLRVSDTDNLTRDHRRVAKRPEEIEDRRHAELGTYRTRMTHRRMEPRREAETDPGGLDAGRDLLGPEIGRDAARAKHGRRAREPRRGPAT